MRQNAPLVIAVLLSACLPQPTRRDAGAESLDGGPRTPRVLDVRVTDVRGEAWPAEIPQRPRFEVTLSHLPFESPPIWLFADIGRADLLDDLAAKPLRVATERHVIPAAFEEEGARFTLTPSERLAPGTAITLGVGAWLRAAETGLTMGEPFIRERVVSDAPEAGARVDASWPPDGAAAVPPHIPALFVRFDGPVTGVDEGLALLDAGGVRVAGDAAPVDCTDAGFWGGWCTRFIPARPLAPRTAHRLEVSERVVDATLAPVGPWAARFTTAAEGDDPPPGLVALPCALDEEDVLGACLLRGDDRLAFRLQIDEPARVSLTVAGQTLLAVAPRGSATLRATGLTPDTTYPAVLRVEDLAGQRVEHALTLQTEPPLLPLSIVEVRGDPLGAEPRQEYVEILNYGPMTVDLEGVAISDRPDTLGDVIMRSQRLAPGQRALIVADRFDPDDPDDEPPVPPGVPLVHIGTSIASGGLTNTGEPLFLRDASMRRLSAVPAMAAPRACLIRVGDDLRSDDAALFAVGPCTPGTAP